jgi:coenzyme F420 hydrogenase subunit beta
MKTSETIESIVARGLCTGCGTCAGLCPQGALVMVVDKREGTCVPQRLPDRCTACGHCLDVCPGGIIELPRSDAEGGTPKPAEALIGEHMQCYLGYAADRELRYQATSGGLVTALLLFALEKGMIDGALVTRMRKDRPLEPEPFVARSREEILQATGSKYCPIPANAVLREIMQKEGKCAVVGLPCHISGIRKAEKVNAVLRERVVLHLGIFCSHGVSFRGTQLILNRLGVRSDDVAGISYRGQGWPGGVRIRLKNGQEKFIANAAGSLWDAIFGGFFFTPPRCLACGDVFNEAADISFGDAWLPEIMAHDRAGTSVVVARSAPALELLKSAAAQGTISLDAMDPSDVVRSQWLFTRFKKTGLRWRLRHFKLPVPPSGRGSALRTVLLNRLAARLVVMNSRGSPSRAGTFLLRHTPHAILRKYVVLLRMVLLSALGADAPDS